MTDLTDELHLPDHDSVLDQAIPFDKVRWMLLWPDATWWPAELDACPTPERWPRVDRRTVFTIAREAGTTKGNRHLLVAALVWGTGTKARSVHSGGRSPRTRPRPDSTPAWTRHSACWAKGAPFRRTGH
ncbi:hypothetical protein OG426_30820 [Streptomyces canus]|nr:hypothetical protein OG426_30820 [Streptomyces canus]